METVETVLEAVATVTASRRKGKNGVFRGEKFLKISIMEAVWKQFEVHLRMNVPKKQLKR